MADEQHDTAAPLTAAEIEAIRTLADMATPGPWSITRYAGGFSFDGPARVYAGTDPEFGEPRVIPAVYADTAFIAHSRADIPRLLATLDAYREIVAAMAGLDEYQQGIGVCILCRCAWREDHAYDCPVIRARALLGPTPDA